MSERLLHCRAHPKNGKGCANRQSAKQCCHFVFIQDKMAAYSVTLAAYAKIMTMSWAVITRRNIVNGYTVL